MKPFRAAIFDLDGTLIDSLHIWEKLDEEFLRKRGFAVPEGYCEKIATMGFLDAAQYAKQIFGFPEPAEEIVREWNQMAAYAYGNEVKMKPHAREYLQKLQRDGIILGVATALPKRLYTPVLENNGVLSWFQAITSGDEVSRGKGFPDIYLKTAEKLGVSPKDCVVFEDILPGLQGAIAAGMQTVGVYDACSGGSEKEMRRLSDAYIYDFKELL